MLPPNPEPLPDVPQPWAGFIVVLVGLVVNAMMLMHIAFPPNLSAVVYSLVDSAFALVGIFLHWNGNTQMKINIITSLRRSGALRALPVLIAIPFVFLALSGCTTIQTWLGGGYNASQTELNEITEAMTIGNDGAAWLDLNCITAPNPTFASLCANKAAIKKGADAYAATVKSLDAIVHTQNADPAAVDALIAALAQDASVVSELENGSAASGRFKGVGGFVVTLTPDGKVTYRQAIGDPNKKAITATDITYIISILEAAIPVAVDVFTQIQQLIASTPTVTTVDQLSATAQTDVAPIDAW